MLSSTNKKRVKKVKKDPNPLFTKWLTEWLDEAAAKGTKCHFLYVKALRSLSKYPLVLKSGKEAKLLKYFGDKICGMLDERLARHRSEFGDEESSTDSEPVQQQPLSLASTSSLVHQRQQLVTATGLQMNTANERQRQSQRKRQRGRGEIWIPRYRCGTYAILITLYNNMQESESKGWMSKVELQTNAQPLCDNSFTQKEPGQYYTAWSSMSTLTKKLLVIKQGSPARYFLTPAGIEKAQLLLNADGCGSGTPVSASERQGSSPRKKKCGTREKHAITAHQECSVESRRGRDVLQSVMLESDDSYQGLRDSFSVGLSSVKEGSFDDSARVMQKPWTCLSSSSDEEMLQKRFEFWYVNSEGKTIKSKDNAAVKIDDVTGDLGFLIQCEATHLEATGKLYTRDYTRPSVVGCVYAYLSDRDAPELCSHAAHIVEARGARSDSVRSSTAVTRTDTAAATDAAQITSSASRASVSSASSSVPRLTSSLGSFDAVSSDSSSVTVLRLPPASSSLAATVVPSASMASLVKPGSQQLGVHIPGSSTVPSFSLSPGSFDIVLCVDNGETRLGHMCQELKLNGVDFDVRKLQVGDFLWIAREKILPKPGQLRVPVRKELTLDFVIERKRMDDLAGSIVDGRFREQKFRMKNCGLRRPIYLVEEYGSAKHYSVPEQTLKQAITNTQVVEGFHVKETHNIQQSAAYLTVMSRYLQSIYLGKTLCSCGKEELSNTQMNLSAHRQPLLTFQEFSDGSIKDRVMTVTEVFAKQLMQISGVSAEKTLAIVTKYPTLVRLMEAYDEVPEKDRELLLSSLKHGQQRNLGPTLSRVIYRLYSSHTLP
ncbi:PREDICTED: crossover junction endonuclease MUS81-like isoform X2 [Priapulus caudatus]|uniref:Crossover junction endonuclease MUS81 n=1 Tax=Priapulus caudatus TaxID=37621 RepID=A0ABM1DRU3_PRICU|nr:PREDICTED: crossover junction endonuclease MUS81-like isoform X2 [Priapulus caudatus]